MSIIKTSPNGFYQYGSNNHQEQARAADIAGFIHDLSRRAVEHPDDEVYRQLLNVTAGGDLQQLYDLTTLFEDLIQLLGKLGQDGLPFNVAKAQATLDRLRQMFTAFEEDKQTERNMHYHALTLHPDCVNVRWTALNYYRSISGNKMYGDSDTTYSDIIGRIKAIVGKEETFNQKPDR